MGKTYFRVIFAIYSVALAFCVGLRVALKLRFTDVETGFYGSGAGYLPLAFNAVLGAAIVLMMVLNVLRRGTHDYQVRGRGTAVSILCAAAGLAIIGFVWLGMPELMAKRVMQSQGETVELVTAVVNYALGALAGLSLLYTGLKRVLTGNGANPAILLVPAVWQLVFLLSRFNGFYSILYISDNLLAVLFMVFAALFFLGHARTLSGLGRSDSRNYVISSGLAASLCGFVLSVPNTVCLALGEPVSPGVGVNVPELACTFVLSVYAYAFTLSYARSIKDV